MATALKSDSWRSYMLYRASDYRSRLFYQIRDEREKAIDAGKKFVLAAYPDVWAKDVALVRRVREFLARNFHWHDRLAKAGSDLEIVQTLFDMVRGGGIVVIPEELQHGGAGLSRPAISIAAPIDNGLSYLEQLRRDDAADAFTDHIFAQIAAAEAVRDARYAAAAALESDHGDAGTATPLSEAKSFEYSAIQTDSLDDAFDIAKTPNAGAPGTWYTNPGSGQMRLYGPSGKPAVDFDFDHDHGQGVPHAHNWAIDPFSGMLKRGSGVPMSVLP